MTIYEPKFSGKNLKFLCDSDFLLSTFGKYCASRAEDYGQLLQAVSDASTFYINSSQEVIYDEDIAEILSAYGISPYSRVMTPKGYIRVRDLLWAIGRDRDYVNITDINTNGILASIPTEDAIEAMVADQINLASLSAAVEAQITGGTIADIMTTFAEAGGALLSSVAASGSAALAYYRNLVRQRLTNASFAAQLFSALDIQAIIDGDQLKTSTESQVYSYTGSSPVGPLDFSKTATAIKTGVKIVGSILGGAANAIGSLFAKAGRYIKTTCVNPNDFSLFEDLGDGTCEGFTKECVLNGYYPLEIAEDPDAEMAWTDGLSIYNWLSNNLQTINSLLAEKLTGDSPLIYKSVFAVYAFQGVNMQITNIEKAKIVGADRLRLTLFFNQVKSITWYRIGDASRLFTCLDAFKTELDGTDRYFLDTDGLDSINRFTSLGGSVNSIVGDVTEEELFQFLSIGPAVEGSPASNIDQSYRTRNLYRVSMEAPDAYLIIKPQVASVTNKNIVDLLVGQDYSLPKGNASPSQGAVSILYAICMSYVDRALFPLDWGFVPYSTDPSDLPVSGFRVKTDEENAAAFNTFATTVITAAVAVGVTVGIGIGLKAASKALFKRREEVISYAQQKMLSGEKMTNSDWRMYRRALKQNRTSTLIESATSPLTTNIPGEDATGLYRIIRGD